MIGSYHRIVIEIFKKISRHETAFFYLRYQHITKELYQKESKLTPASQHVMILQ